MTTERTGSSGAPPKILVVEDSLVEAEVLRRSLAGVGYQVIMASNGQEGLQAARASRPDLVVSDIRMPQMDGYQLCRTLKLDAELWDVPVILLTVLSEPEDIMEAINSGADGYITKPFVEASLLERSRSLLATPIIRRRAEERRSEFVEHHGKPCTITGGSQQILHLLLSVYENTLSQNHDLTQTKILLNQLNESLDDQVRERTAALMESAERFRNATETMRDAFIVIEGEGGIISGWNTAAEAIFGYSKKEAIGQVLHDFLVPPRFRTAMAKGLEHFAKTGDGAFVGKTHELVALRKDGSQFPFEFSLSAMQIRGRWFATGIGRDITERKIYETSLVLAREQAEAASRAKSEFLANMSHEIRTPLNGVLGMLHLLTLDCGEEAHREYVTLADKAGRRLLTLLDNVLNFSRLESGQATLLLKPFNVRELVNSVQNIFLVANCEKALALSATVDESVPEMLVGDEARLQQVLFNLVGNSIKFTSNGSVCVEVWSKPSLRHTDKTWLYLTVSDTGVGIPDDKIAYIFDRFTQANASYTRPYEGAGLGLAIVKRIVELMGGDITVESEVGTGTKVYVSLLLGGAAHIESAPQLAAVEMLDKPLRILLADDEPINRLSMQVVLERMGHSVTSVDNGRAALRAWGEGNFDCILMDVQMPEMDGVTATQAIRSQEVLYGKAYVRIIALTAYAMEGDREEFLATGMDDYIAKPVQLAALRCALSKVNALQHQLGAE